MVRQVREQLDVEGNTKIQLPVNFNFAFDIIDYAADHHDKTAYLEVSSDGDTVISHSFSELKQRSSRVANFLEAIGCQRGEFAMVILPRIPAWYEVIIGTIKLGVVSMPGTNLLTAKDIEYRVNKSGATTVIVTPEHVAKVEEIRSRCPTLKYFIAVGDSVGDWHNYERGLQTASPELVSGEPGGCKGTDLMMAYFTSGTTAGPKLVPRDHHYALAHLTTGAYWLDLRPDDIHWTLSDTGWAKAAWGMLFSPWLLNTTLILYNGSGFDADLHLRLISRLGVTTFCAPPTIFRMFAQLDLNQYSLSSIRHTVSAGEPLNPEVIKVWQSATGNSIYDGYGQTETVNIVANRPSLPVKAGSMGKSVPGFDVRVVDDEGQIVADDEIGHIALVVTDPPPIGLFDGYYDGVSARNRDSFRNGLYYTGDTATRDSDGYIWFVGRSDDVISSSGYRISPFEVESVLLEHPAVAESAVVGKPDELRGQLVKAFIVLADGIEASDKLIEDIQEFVKVTTAPYKYPREIEFRENLPKTISGKIRRIELRAET
ncbi:acyl-CoA synthetase [Chromatiales bacterium (ex Bugula neritina AB1)]|nr:acyl-CoA synthetase [Chromatiales bacterium (ex Bugula neritina AB1)]